MKPTPKNLELANKRVEILVAKSDDRVVGFMGLWQLGRYMRYVATIGVSVHPDYRGNGIAIQLLDAAVKTAKQWGFRRLEIETLSTNNAMRHMAENMGFS